MTISNLNCEELVISSDVITDYLDSPESYNNMIIEVKNNCCETTKYYEEFILEDGDLPVSDKFDFVGNTIHYHIDEEGKDRVYTVKIKFTSTEGTIIQDSNCYFFDCNTKCRVAQLISGFTSDDKKEVDETFIAHMAYFGLINASNCGCNCEELCTLSKFLLTLLEDLNIENCGC